MHVISPPGRLSVPNICACIAFAVSRHRSQFARLAKDAAIVGLPLNRGAVECLPNGECSLAPGVTVCISQVSSIAWPSRDHLLFLVSQARSNPTTKNHNPILRKNFSWNHQLKLLLRYRP